MIDLYTWGTPNGQKVSILLEEVGLKYQVRPVDLRNGEQLSPDFLAINPNGKIPAIVDHDGADRTVVFESGAILIYLADKAGQLIGATPSERANAMAWTFWQVGGLGPMMGQWMHFSRAAPETLPYAVARFRGELDRLLEVLERRLGESQFLAGPYSIADIANFTWARAALRFLRESEPNVVQKYPAILRWLATIESRPAVVRGLAVPQAASP